MIGRVLRLRGRRDLPRWPRYHEGAKKVERLWIESLNARELAQLAAPSHQVERAVDCFHNRKGTA